MAEIVIYTRMFCGFCTAAKSLLNKRGLEFEEIDAGVEAFGFAQVDEVFEDDVAGGTRCKRAAAEAAERCIKNVGAVV